MTSVLKRGIIGIAIQYMQEVKVTSKKHVLDICVKFDDSFKELVFF